MLKKGTILLLICVTTFCLAQDGGRSVEHQLWTGFISKLGITDNLQAQLQQQLRMDHEGQNFKATFTEFGAQYRFTNFFALKALYRYRVNNDIYNEARVTLDAELKYLLQSMPITFDLRSRIQDARVSETHKKSSYFRNQLGVRYQLSKVISPFIAYECHFKLNHINEVRENRFTAGVKLKPKEMLDIAAFYRLDYGVNVKEPTSEYILGLMVSYKMKLRKK